VFGFPPSSRSMSVWSTVGLKGMHDPFALALHHDHEELDA
jgi:hypothetical protein